jgi:hypothetical protein
MALIRKFFRYLRPLKKAKRYSEEVLYAGWVTLSPLHPPKPRR